jgi:hypothetical protein
MKPPPKPLHTSPPAQSDELPQQYRRQVPIVLQVPGPLSTAPTHTRPVSQELMAQHAPPSSAPAPTIGAHTVCGTVAPISGSA